MNAIFMAALAVTKPGAVGIGIAALILVFLAFKFTRFIIKMLLLLAAIGLAVWWYAAHHGSL
jgi:hypothetical protein